MKRQLFGSALLTAIILIGGYKCDLISNTTQDLQTAALLQSPATKEIQQKSDRILISLSRNTRKLGLTFLGPDYLLPEWGSIQEDVDPSLYITGTTVRLSSAAHDFTFRKEDGRICSYQNRQISVFTDGPRATLYDSPDKPKWTKDQALRVGTMFRDILLNPMNTKLGKPSVEYVHTSYVISKVEGKINTKSHVGQWLIGWPRVDGEGHPFFGDHVTVEISEQYGLIGAGISLFTPFVQQSGKRLSQSEALWYARLHVAWSTMGDRFWRMFSNNPYDRIESYDPYSGGLMVTIPNVGWTSPISPPPARLVWEFWFKPVHAAPSIEPTYDDRFSVWIDAYTGRTIGGDAML